MTARRASADHGHTLLEVLVALAVVACLATLATASYTHFVVAARRFDARAALLALAAAQERHFLRHAEYAARLAPTRGAPAGTPGEPAPEAPTEPPPGTLRWPDVSPQSYYAVAIATAENGGYRLEARPRGAQAGDRECAVFVLDGTGLRGARSAAGADTTRRCWSGA